MQVVVTTVIGVVATMLLGFALHLHLPELIGLIAFGAAWGGGMGAAGAYALRPLSLLGLFLDLSWSIINTFVGLIWLVICLARGSLQVATADSARSGTLVISGAALPGAAATTMGNVIGGLWLAHEEVHVWQARIFGPFYWPIYLLSYVANMIVLILTLRFRDLHWAAYGRDVMEDWAELACPAKGASASTGDVNWGWWLLGLLCAAFYALCIALIASSLPVLRGILHFPPLPLPNAFTGLIGILLFALIRSALPRTD
jgi:hypothetical protein